MISAPTKSGRRRAARGARLDGRLLESQLPKEQIEILAFEATRTASVAEKAAAVVDLAYRLRIMGSLALSLCHLAAGRIDAVCSLKPARAVDIAAAQLLVLERGLAIDLPDAAPFAAEPLARSPKLGPVLWQLPANFRRDDERLRAALAALPRGRHCFEFRHSSWFVDSVYDLLRAHGAALVIGDRPEVKAFQSHELTADWTYLRFHYGSRGRRGNYSRSELEEWARRLEDWRREVEIYAYFNNDWEAFA